MAERYRISYREEIDDYLRIAYRDSFDEVVDWIAANGNQMKQIFVIREDALCGRTGKLR